MANKGFSACIIETAGGGEGSTHRDKAEIGTRPRGLTTEALKMRPGA